MFGSGGIRSDVGQIHLGLLRAGQLDFGFLSGLFETLRGQRVVVQIDAVFLLELIGEKFNQPKVKVLTAEERVAVSGQDLKLMLSINLCNFNDGDVEGAAAQVVDSDGLPVLGRARLDRV